MFQNAVHGQPRVQVKCLNIFLLAIWAGRDVGHFWFALYEITNRTERIRAAAQKYAQFIRHAVCHHLLTSLVISQEYSVHRRMYRE